MHVFAFWQLFALAEEEVVVEEEATEEGVIVVDVEVVKHKKKMFKFFEN